jgi:hypothetical protein
MSFNLFLFLLLLLLIINKKMSNNTSNSTDYMYSSVGTCEDPLVPMTTLHFSASVILFVALKRRFARDIPQLWVLYPAVFGNLIGLVEILPYPYSIWQRAVDVWIIPMWIIADTVHKIFDSKKASVAIIVFSCSIILHSCLDKLIVWFMVDPINDIWLNILSGMLILAALWHFRLSGIDSWLDNVVAVGIAWCLSFACIMSIPHVWKINMSDLCIATTVSSMFVTFIVFIIILHIIPYLQTKRQGYYKRTKLYGMTQVRETLREYTENDASSSSVDMTTHTVDAI